MSNQGFFLIGRGLLKHPRFKPQGAFSSAEAMLWLIEEAAFAPRVKPIMIGTERRVVYLQRGQMAHSIRFLATAWCWSCNRVRRFLRDLADDGTVATRTDTGITIITLCNYEKYQKPFSGADTQTDTQSNTQTDTNEKELKELNVVVVEARAREPAMPLSGRKEEVSQEKQAAIALGLAFLNAAGFEDHVAAPRNWRGVTGRAAKWIDAGWSEQMIVAETKRIIASRSMPTSVNYFETVFAGVHADANRALPVVATLVPGVARANRPRQQDSRHRPIRPEIAAEREWYGLPPARPGSVSDAGELLLARAKRAEQEGRNLFPPLPGTPGASEWFNRQADQDRDASEVVQDELSALPWVRRLPPA